MRSILIKNGRIINTRAGTLSAKKHIYIEDDRIKEISDVGSMQADTLVDADGRVVMPGLCDAHVHVVAATASFSELSRWSPLYTAARASRIMEGMLMRGFTTVRDCGGADYGLSDSVNEGYFNGPRILFCGHALSQSGGHGDMRDKGEAVDPCTNPAVLGVMVDGVTEVRRACRNEIRKGAHFIKVMASGGVASPTDRIGNTQFSEEELGAAVQEAEAAGLYVAAHVYTARAANRALKCGVRSIEHGNLIDDLTIDLLLETESFLVPTMSTHEVLGSEGVENGMPEHLCRKVFEVVEAGKKTHAYANGRGVRMVFGTDLLGNMHRHQLIEFQIRSAFQRPDELIRSATLTAAQLFQMEGEIGEICEESFADILVIDGNPLENISCLQSPEKFLKCIFKSGQIIKNELC